ncbi:MULTISPECIES: hypothetical protein [Bacillota]|uniref:hypothetical protein n=1 Tax=Bacillota TaxID=1239 RepID=UPI0039F0A311
MIIATDIYVQDNDDGRVSMIYDRKDISGWIVEVVGIGDEEKFEGVFRTAIRDGKECEQFTLYPTKDSDYTIVQVRIYKNGDVLTYGFVPVNVVVFKRKKKIKIELLCDIEINDTGECSITLIEDY